MYYLYFKNSAKVLPNTPLPNKNDAGFTILEVVVAISLITVGITAIFTLYQQTISITRVSSQRLIAAYLAQEGIEIVRNIRDTNWIEDQAWDTGLGEGSWEGDYQDTQSLTPWVDPGNYLEITPGGFYEYSGSSSAIPKRIAFFDIIKSTFKDNISKLLDFNGTQVQAKTQPSPPTIIAASVVPIKVQPGDTMLVEAQIADDYGIKEVTADMGGIETINLKLKEGTIKKGKWQAEWLVHDVEVKEYITPITATNILGLSSQKEIKWSDDPAWLTGWSYRKSHVINSSSGAGSNYQVKITVHYGSDSDSGEDVYCNSHCRTDFGDVRFTDNDETTLLDYWIESKTDSDNAVFWVEVADDLSSSAVTIYIYYGKSDATYPFGDDQAEMDATFPFADHYYGSSLDTDKWSVISGTVSVTGGECILNPSKAAIAEMKSNTFVFGYNYAMMDRAMADDDTTQLCSARYDANNRIVTYIDWGVPHLWFRTYSGGSYTTTQVDITVADIYFRWEWTRVSGTVKAYRDGSLYATHTDNLPTQDLFIRFYAGATDRAVCDWVAVRKFVDPEPSHGSWGSEETPVSAPTVTTSATTNVEETTASGRGNVTDTGGENPTRYIEWGTTVAYGSECNAGVGGTGNYSCLMSGLNPGTLYHCRAKACNSIGCGYGNDETFITKPDPPTGLTATTISQTQIDLTWTDGAGAESTEIVQKVGSSPADPSDGITIYSGLYPGSPVHDYSVICGNDYYYRAWSHKTGAPNLGYSDESYEDYSSTLPCACTLTVIIVGSGTVSDTGINCGVDCTEDYTSGTLVTLTADPDSGSTFTGWSGDALGCGASLTCDLIMDSNKGVTATFNVTCPDGVCDVAGGECDTCDPDCDPVDCCGTDPDCNTAVGENSTNCPGDCPLLVTTKFRRKIIISDKTDLDGFPGFDRMTVTVEVFFGNQLLITVREYLYDWR